MCIKYIVLLIILAFKLFKHHLVGHARRQELPTFLAFILAFDLYDVPGGVHARGQEEDTESISDDVVDSLAQMMAQLFVLGGAATAAAAGPQEILSAAAKGEASIVRKLLQARPELVS